MISWGLFLHFYQPPTQYPWVLEKITNECYRPVIDVFRRNPKARATVNINGVLLEMLKHEGEADIVDGFAELVRRGQWEVVGTAKYHVILPLLPAAESARQIALQKKSLGEYLGVSSERGFFPPEMCISPEMLRWIRDADYEWIIASGTSVNGTWPTDRVVHDPKSGVKVLFRDEVISNRISFERLKPEAFLQHLEQIKPKNKQGYVITAMDGETFGHHIPHWEKDFLERTYRLIDTPEYGSRIRSVKLSEIVDAFTAPSEMEPRPSSWSTTGHDLTAGIPYPLWRHPSNELHRMQWEYLNLCIDQVGLAQSAAPSSAESKRYAEICRSVLDEAEHSCPFWWASRRPLEGLSMIYRGLWLLDEVLVNATRAVQFAPGADDLKTKARRNFDAAASLSTRLKEFLSFNA